jgi:hypothetical protein
MHFWLILPGNVITHHKCEWRMSQIFESARITATQFQLLHRVLQWLVWFQVRDMLKVKALKRTHTDSDFLNFRLRPLPTQFVFLYWTDASTRWMFKHPSFRNVLFFVYKNVINSRKKQMFLFEIKTRKSYAYLYKKILGTFVSSKRQRRKVDLRTPINCSKFKNIIYCS